MRPRSVTIVGWWILITALWGVYSSAVSLPSNPFAVELAARTGVSMQVQQVFGVLNGFVLAFCAMTILKGYWWSRLFFVGWSFVGFLYGFVLLGFLVSALLFVLNVGVILFFLSRPRANQWFA